MSSPVWPLKCITIPGMVDVRFGGRDGIDQKMMLFPSAHKEYHYTCRMFTTPENLSSIAIPFDLHKTWDGSPKRYLPLAKGALDVCPLVRKVTQFGMPRVDSVDISSSDWRNREVVPLDPLLPPLLGKKTLTVTPEWVDLLAFKPISKIGNNNLLAAMPADEDGREGGMIIQAENHAYFLRIPVLEMLDRLDDEMEESLSVIHLADIEDEFDDIASSRIVDSGT